MKKCLNNQSLKTKQWSLGLALLALGAGGTLVLAQHPVPAPEAGKPGGPVVGLTPEQLRLFDQTKELFTHNFTPEEGLGPTFNAVSCYECHGKPGPVGGEGRDISTTSVVHISKRSGASAGKPLKDVICELRENDVDPLRKFGGPALQKKSITTEFKGKFPPEAKIEPGKVTKEAELVGSRHTGPVYGLGLVDAVPDETFVKLAAEQKQKYPQIAGRVAMQFDPFLKKKRPGRVGYKNQYVDVSGFSAEAMRGELGVSASLLPTVPIAKQEKPYPQSIAKSLPSAPNDKGKVLLSLSYFQKMLAAPPRGKITEEAKLGEKTFDKIHCAVCHTPLMKTASKVEVPDPKSPLPKVSYIEVKALENKSINPYSDFLLHQMGNELADGMPQLGAKGGEWRTTPLWWLSTKKFYLHDGRATTLEAAILAHGGQSASVTESYKKLSAKEKSDLVAFLKSL